MHSNYPDNWKELAAANKRAAGYRCSNCRLKCLPPGRSYRHLSLSLRRKLSAQTHHIDGNPSNSNSDNLVCLCSGCHLALHRHRTRITPGQLSLPIELKNARRKPKPARRQSHIDRINYQMTFVDLIERLPCVTVSFKQLELLTNLSKRDF